MKKKFFAVFMCLIMVLVFMPTMAWAEGETQTEYGLLGGPENGGSIDDFNFAVCLNTGDTTYLYQCQLNSEGEIVDDTISPVTGIAESAFQIHIITIDEEGNVTSSEKVDNPPFTITSDDTCTSIMYDGNADGIYWLQYVTVNDGDTFYSGTLQIHAGVSDFDEGGEAEDTETSEDLFCGFSTDITTWGGVGNYVSVTEQETVIYLYQAADTNDTEGLDDDDSVGPFTAVEGGCFFKDSEGNDIDSAPFTLAEAENGFWSLTYTGSAETRDYYFYATDAEDAVHGPLVIQVDVAEADPQPPVKPVWPSVPVTSNPLPAAKTASTAAVNSYVDLSEYEDAQAAEIKAIQEKAKADIAAAKNEEEVKAIEEAAKGEIDKIETAEELAEIAAIESTRFEVKSAMTTLNGKTAVKVSWTVPEGMEFDGFDVFRSTKRYSGFGTKPFFTTEKTAYTNNKGLKKGTTYFYKVRGFTYVNDEKVYSDYSYKAWRTIK